MPNTKHAGSRRRKPGDRSALVDSQERPIAVPVTTYVRIEALDNVSFHHALDEGEGQSSVAPWHKGHEAFWNRSHLTSEEPRSMMARRSRSHTSPRNDGDI
ncbi:ASCH domain-containing protein [uncultured Bifidobacterium sp.]|uniref:ASCH domain-containing protein n=1 Tax=uncultured Bifidobacterium sp. TaxID=165187 RepID=UPI0033900BD0